MPHIISDKEYRRMLADQEELNAYRGSGLNPDEVMQMMACRHDPAPLPLDLWADDAPPGTNTMLPDIHLAGGLLDDGI